jgi:hypothetical protein
MKRLLLSILTLLLVLPVAVADITSTTWTKVTSDDDFDLSARYILVSTNSNKYYVCSYNVNSNALSASSTTVSVKDNKISSVPDDAGIFEFKTTSNTGSYIYNLSISTYAGTLKGYYVTSSVKKMSLDTDISKATACNVSISASRSSITFSPSAADKTNEIQFNYNSGSTKFTNYESNQTACVLYKEVSNKHKAEIAFKDEDAQMQEVSVGDELNVEDLFTVTVADDDADQTYATKAKEALKFKLEDGYSEYATLSNNDRTLTITGYNDGFYFYGAIEKSNDFDEATSEAGLIGVKPYIELSDLMPEKLLVGQTVYIPYTTHPEEAKSYVDFIADDEYDVEIVDNASFKITAKEVTAKGEILFYFKDGTYKNGDDLRIALPIEEGSIPDPVTVDCTVTTSEKGEHTINISAGDAITFSSNNAGYLQVYIGNYDTNEEETINTTSSSYTYTFNTAGKYGFIVTPVTTAGGLEYYYEGLAFDCDVTVEAVEQQAVELEIVGDEAYTIAYNGSVKGGWVTIKDEAQADALKDITYSTEVVAGNPVVSVDTDGNISASNPGTVKVIASLNSTKYKADPVSITVTINKKPIVLSVNEDAPKEVTVYGEIAAGWLTATMDGTVDADALSAVLYDYDSDYVDVENGKITAKKSGTVTITATIPEENTVYQIGSVTYTITINKAPVTLKSTDKAVTTVMEGSTVEDWFAVDLGDLSENEEAQAEVKKHIGYELGEGSAYYVTVEEGKITAVAAGEATVTAVLMDNDYFTADPATLTYSLTVTEKPLEFTFNFTQNKSVYGMDLCSGSSYNSLPLTIHSDDDAQLISCTFTGTPTANTTSNVRLWSDGIRVYSGSFGMQFSMVDGYEITGIEFNGSLFSLDGITATPGEYKKGSSSNGTWSGTQSNTVAISISKDNLTAQKLIKTIKVSYTKLESVDATIIVDNSQHVGLGDSKELAFSTEPAEAAEFVEVSTDDENISVAKNDDGKWIVTGVNTTTAASYTLSMGQSRYKAEPVNGSIQVVTGMPQTNPTSDENGNLTAPLDTDVTFTSNGADGLKISIVKDDETVLEETSVENGYAYQFDELGVYTVTAKPLYKVGDVLSAYDESYGLTKIFKVTVSEIKASASSITLNKEKDSFNMSGTGYALYPENVFDDITYAAKASLNDGMQINSNTTGNGTKSGIASILNTKNKVIDHIVVNKKSGNGSLIVKMGNEPNVVVTDENIANTAVNASESAVEISRKDGETSTNGVFTYKPTEDYKYFHISSNGSLIITSVEVYYKALYKLDPEMELCKDQDGTVAESKVLQYYMSDAYESINFDELIYSSVSATDREGVTNNETVVTYTSSDPKVATVNKTTGEVTILRMGTTIITATYPGNDNYVPTKASYTINVGFMNPTTEEEGVVPEPLVFDQYDILLPKAFINNVNNGLEDYFIETVTLSVRHKPGYLVYYSQNMERIGDEGTFDKKPTESPAGVRAYDSESNSEEKWEELTLTGSDGDSYATGIFEPYAAGKYASTIKFKAVDAAGNESEEVVLNLSKPTGVSTVEAEESSAEAVYYNLQGERVKNPERGIYIRVIGNRATKVAM